LLPAFSFTKYPKLQEIMIIRRATNGDLSGIMEMLKAVIPAMQAAGNDQWDSHYPNKEVFKEDILKNQLWVAEVDQSIAGIAAITTDQEPEYAEVGWNISETAIVTHRLAVGVNFRGLGIAQALLLQAEQEAVERHISVLRIDTNTNNAATRALFPKLGYQYSGEIGLGFRPNLRFCCYEKRIRPSVETDPMKRS
jgi:ribosomal protein S18 acetylase RimI-like enzyme